MSGRTDHPVDRPSSGLRRGSGPGRVLVAVYAVFALSASARAAVQISTDLASAPVAYLLSALAAAVYVVATVALATPGRRAQTVAVAAVAIELVGVLVVGTVSTVRPQHFPEATVWSSYGRGYAFVPLVLPVVGLWWLWVTRRAGQDRENRS